MRKDLFWVLHVKYRIDPICRWMPGYWPFKAFDTEQDAVRFGARLMVKHPAVFGGFKPINRRRTTSD